MAKEFTNRSGFQSYPHLAKSEFTEACHFLDRLYSRAKLGSVRRRWRLQVHRAFDMTFGMTPDDDGQSSYVRIVRPLEADVDDDLLAAALERVALGPQQLPDIGAAPILGHPTVTAGGDYADEAMRDAENADVVALRSTAPTQLHKAVPELGYVAYEIHLHPTYRVPCLWFSLHGLPVDEKPLDVDTVLRRLVPDQYKDGLRKVGGVGGISMDYHPTTSLPSFFIHPCFLGEAMEGFDCSKEDYLMVWLGLVGGCVGLWVPSEMAIEAST